MATKSRREGVFEIAGRRIDFGKILRAQINAARTGKPISAAVQKNLDHLRAHRSEFESTISIDVETANDLDLPLSERAPHLILRWMNTRALLELARPKTKAEQRKLNRAFEQGKRETEAVHAVVDAIMAA